MGKKVFIKTFGCQMNEYDSEKINDVLASKNKLTQTKEQEDADLIVLNTCSIREKAEVKVYSDLGRIRKLKESNPNLRIAVGGCVASQEGSNIIKKAPYVDIVFGPQTLHRLPDLIKAREKNGKPQIDISFPEIEKFDHLPVSNSINPSSMVSIMEGCSKYCSFCVVPYTRGEEVSRPLNDVLKEIITKNISEVTLLGQNVNAYRGLMDNGEIADFATLIEYVSEISEIKRIRFSTSHPNEMSDALIDCFNNIDKLAKMIHLPIQAGSDRVLSAMKRNYTTLEYKSIIRKLRKKCPGISITSDFIVGFPTETLKDFNSTKSIMKELEFDYSFSFIYSPRPGTPASYLEDLTSHEEKLKRLHELQTENMYQGEIFTKKMLSTTQRILIDSKSKRKTGVFLGKTDNNRVVEIEGDKSLLNKFVTVKIDKILKKNIQGTII
ncbi:tRNA (N6-isopentenyl adenosine(37)-C2)-methylthiotransferase MiaB [Methylophilaceae bacterium]|jgi:tRNA-2-methylthio-N6-dimethylallyladenosine synthase|nr:tRNA (N6-isopentenyl adenosine(37)-C2)-methylthiotransferase MiaB [Methylophilaceae bacterium]|tara:strand:+ start:5096 stop:6409 length:1314 start_codon:yes stop_codon:yes gene_type:complete